MSVPEKNGKGDSLLFYLSPNDLVYVSTKEEKENLIDLKSLSKEHIYKIVSFTGNRLYAIQNRIASPIVDKVEFTQLNKMEFTPEKTSIKDCCWKLKVDRLGNIIETDGKKILK